MPLERGRVDDKEDPFNLLDSRELVKLVVSEGLDDDTASIIFSIDIKGVAVLQGEY